MINIIQDLRCLHIVSDGQRIKYFYYDDLTQEMFEIPKDKLKHLGLGFGDGEL